MPTPLPAVLNNQPEVRVSRQETPAPTDEQALLQLARELSHQARAQGQVVETVPHVAADKAKAVGAALDAVAVLKKMFPDETVLLIY